MTGDFQKIGNEYYVYVNDQGTLAKLPRLPWYRVLQLLLSTRKRRTYGYVRSFFYKYKK